MLEVEPIYNNMGYGYYNILGFSLLWDGGDIGIAVSAKFSI